MSAIPKILFRPAVAAALALCAASAAQAQSYPVNLLQTAQTEAQEWSYTYDQPASDWMQSGFSDASWNKGLGGFGQTGTPGAVIFTGWTTPDIWLRKTITIKDLASKSGLAFLMHHDEDVEVYVNGTQVLTLTGYTVKYEESYLDISGIAAFQEGDNVIAAHCHQTVGGQYLDLGLVEHITGDATELVKGTYDGGQDWKYTEIDPNEDWTAPDYNDEAWTTSQSAFGQDPDLTSNIRTPWSTPDIFARTRFTVPAGGFDHMVLGLAHDDEATVYLNGKKVASMTGYQTISQSLDITDAAKDVIKEGENVLAATCHSTIGGQYLDVSLTGLKIPVPVALAPGNRYATPEAARFFSWSPGRSRLIVGIPGSSRRVDVAGRAASLRR